MILSAGIRTFQSPGGDSSFFYERVGELLAPYAEEATRVSVPRRGFIILLLEEIEEQIEEVASRHHVSVPRRGFIILLLEWLAPGRG